MAVDLNDEIVKDFLVEASEILEQLGERLVELETRPEDADLLNTVFRGFHTIKGGAGFIGLDAMVGVCHCAEDTFNLLRNGERGVDAPLMDVVLQVLDVLHEMFETVRGGEEPAPADAELMRKLGILAENGVLERPSGAGPAGPCAAAEAAGAGVTDTEYAQIIAGLDETETPGTDVAGGGDDEITEAEFEALLDGLHGSARPGQATQGGAPCGPDPQDRIPENEPGVASDAVPDAGEAPAEGEISEEEFEDLLDGLHGKGQGPVAAPGPSPSPSAEPAAKAHSAETTVRVDTGILDRIMNMVGELVLVRNRISTLETASSDEEMAKAVGNLDVVTADLQAAVMRTRMQPIRKVFGRFPRVVRDLARSLGKEVDLVLQGEETDLDKNLVEALADPMVHLVRNAVDHGLEGPAERVAAGKPRTGTVTLSAEQEGDQILLIVRDDGRGIDAGVLRRKAVEKGLMDEDAAARLDDRDCYHLVFAPGFSTKSEISDVSGRGVGMDVVKSRITQLNGSVDIDSTLGEGTRILIKVPLTLAIVPTLMVVLGDQPFALPLVNVKEIFDLDLGKTNVVDGRLTVLVRGKPLPLFYLAQWLVGRQIVHRRERGHVVVVHVGTQMVGFVVDQLVGQEEVVVKPLGALLQGTKGLAGATITGNGRIALILDAPGLLSSYAARR